MNTLEKKLLPIARQWAGNIPIWAAKEAGIDPSAIRHWAQDNPDVTNPVRGVYTWFCDDDQIDWENSSFARYLAKAGKDAFLWGPSVLEFMEIGDVAQPVLFISVPKRRREIEPVKWVIDPNGKPEVYRNLPVQPLEDAVQAAMPFLDLPKKRSVIADLIARYPKQRGLAKQLGAKYGIV